MLYSVVSTFISMVGNLKTITFVTYSSEDDITICETMLYNFMITVIYNLIFF